MSSCDVGDDGRDVSDDDTASDGEETGVDRVRVAMMKIPAHVTWLYQTFDSCIKRLIVVSNVIPME